MTQPSGWRCEPFGWRHAVVCRPRTRLGWQKITEVGRFRTLSGLGLDAALPAIRAFLKSRGRDAPRFSDFGKFLPFERKRGGYHLGDILRADAHCPPRAERVGSWRVLTESRSHLVAALPDGDRVASPSRRDAEAREASMSKGPRFAVPRGNFPQNPSKQRGCGVRRSQARRFDRRALAGKKRGGARNGSRGRGGDNVSSL